MAVSHACSEPATGYASGMKLLLLAAGLALAQSPSSTPAPAPPGAATNAPGSNTAVTPGAAAHADDAAIVRALDLPASAGKLRNAGVPEADVRGSLGAMREAGVSAGDATEVTEATVTDVAAHGPVDNFGAFVQERLASGLRGRELAAAIAAEHQARGKGKQAGGHHGDHANAGHDHAAGGKPDGAGHGNMGGGHPENAGAAQPHPGGRPDAGHAGGHGKSGEKEKEK